MPYKDKSKHFYPLIGVVFSRKEAVYAAMEEASKKAGITKQEFLRIAAKEKLIRDGYIQPDEENPA